MVEFHTRCPDVAAREVRTASILPGNDVGGLPADQYAFVECYCDDPKCDCRRAFIQVRAQSRPREVLASINFGWEPAEFYRKKMPHMPEAAGEIVAGSLDPINAQSKHSAELLGIFQMMVADAVYKARLKRHYELFRRSRPR